MLLSWVTAAYLVYLVIPIALLIAGSFGELWLNTLLPTGSTLRWYREVANDPSFRRAFVASLSVAALACTACVAIGLPLAYAVYRARNPRVRALARVLYQLHAALPPLNRLSTAAQGFGTQDGPRSPACPLAPLSVSREWVRATARPCAGRYAGGGDAPSRWPRRVPR